MSEFHRIDFFRVALQVRGSTQPEIELALDGLRKLQGSKFDSWNRTITDEEERVLAVMLGPQGHVLAAELLEGFKREFVARCGISAEEFERLLRAQREGLN